MKKFLSRNINTILALFTMVIVAIVAVQIEMQTGLGLAMAIAVYTKACSKNVAGNTFIAVCEVGNMTSFTVAGGEITAVTPNAALRFMKADATIDTIIRSEEGTGNGNNIAYEHKIELKTTKPSLALNTWRQALADGSPCGLLAVVADGNGQCWLTGYSVSEGFKRPLRLTKDSFTSGGAPGDAEGQQITIELGCTTGYVDLPFNAALSAAVIGGTATAWITYT